MDRDKDRDRDKDGPAPRHGSLARPKLLSLPARGRLLVAADLHGNLRDFLAISERFERLSDRIGEDAHLLFLGDLIHGPYLPPGLWSTAASPYLRGRPYRDESPALLLSYQLLCERHPGRVHALLGNHEHAHLGGPRTALFAPDEVAALEQRLGIEASMQLSTILRALPLCALAPCGILFSHAPPAADLRGPEDLEALDYRLWSATGAAARRVESRLGSSTSDGRRQAAQRMAQSLWQQTLSPFKAQAVLAALSAQVLVYGHTVIPDGYQAIGYEQLILSSSFGMEDEHKVLLELDLGGTYLTVDDLRPGSELVPLYPQARPVAAFTSRPALGRTGST
jgi:hypothetical protein